MPRQPPQPQPPPTGRNVPANTDDDFVELFWRALPARGQWLAHELGLTRTEALNDLIEAHIRILTAWLRDVHNYYGLVSVDADLEKRVNPRITTKELVGIITKNLSTFRIAMSGHRPPNIAKATPTMAQFADVRTLWYIQHLIRDARAIFPNSSMDMSHNITTFDRRDMLLAWATMRSFRWLNEDAIRNKSHLTRWDGLPAVRCPDIYRDRDVHVSDTEPLGRFHHNDNPRPPSEYGDTVSWSEMLRSEPRALARLPTYGVRIPERAVSPPPHRGENALRRSSRSASPAAHRDTLAITPATYRDSRADHRPILPRIVPIDGPDTDSDRVAARPTPGLTLPSMRDMLGFTPPRQTPSRTRSRSVWPGTEYQPERGRPRERQQRGRVNWRWSPYM